MSIKRKQNVELLAPAGSIPMLQAVIEAGCDAVYIGGSRFGARAYADNPQEDELRAAIDYAHLRGVSVYLTINTLLKDTELSELYAYLLPYYKQGLDAVIVQDLGVMQWLSKHFPDLTIHASTQMTITEEAAAALLPAQVNRIVPARELTLAEIDALRKTGLELEIFVHGALCYSYSGQCLMSSMIGGRSGNRGRCAQPCRKWYQLTEQTCPANADRGADGKAEAGGKDAAGYLLSPKDQCTLRNLHKILEAGADSLKIEGRMKSAAYGAGVVSVYRKWLDRYQVLGAKEYEQYLQNAEAELRRDEEMLMELYNRGGFCSGYTGEQPGPSMMSIKRPNHSGVKVGTAVVKKGMKPTAAIKWNKTVGPQDVLELRAETADGRSVPVRELTIGKDGDIKRYQTIVFDWKRQDGPIPAQMEVYRLRNEALLTRLTEQYLENRKPIGVCGFFYAQAGEPICLTITDISGETSVTVTGPTPEAASKSPATEAQVKGRLEKTGETAFAWEQLTVELKGELFLPVSWLNALRREAFARFEKAKLAEYHRQEPIAQTEGISLKNTLKNTEMMRTERTDTEPICMVTVMTGKQLQAILTNSAVDAVTIDLEGEEECFDLFERMRGICTKMPRLGIALPRICREKAHKELEKKLPELLQQYALDYIFVRTLNELQLLTELAKVCPMPELYADHTLYVMNREAASWQQTHGIARGTLSTELREEELQKLGIAGTILPVYGRAVVMVSAQCVLKNTTGCRKKNGQVVKLRDSEKEYFPVRTCCKYCCNLIYNSKPLSLFPYMKRLLAQKPYAMRIDLTTEDAYETGRVLQSFSRARTGIANEMPEKEDGCTRGHFRRGVQ